MGSLEITMSIKCGECISHSSYSLKRNDMEDMLELADTINKHYMKRFKATQSYSDVIHIECTKCGHKDKLGI